MFNTATNNLAGQGDRQFRLMVRQLLTELSLDLQVHICEFLHPSYILALRQTCKVLHRATLQRIVWIHALKRICHQNFLFLPTFPIPDMSVHELERAATAPSRWIALSSSKNIDDSGHLPSRTTIIRNPVALMSNNCDPEFAFPGIKSLFLVPGGRYLVAGSEYCVGVWDLECTPDASGNMSSKKKPKVLWSTRLNKLIDVVVQPTPDGLGIRIFTHSLNNPMYVFEIYPNEMTHEHAKIAELSHNLRDTVVFLCGNRAVIYNSRKVIVWDFIANTVASLTVGVLYHSESEIIRVTDKALICIDLCCWMGWIFQIPPLLPQTLHFNEDLPETEPILTFNLSELEGASIMHHLPDLWYYGHDDLSSLPIYFDMLKKGDVGRYVLNISPDLSNVSLSPLIRRFQNFDSWQYRICEDSSVELISSTEDDMDIEVVNMDLSLTSANMVNSSQIPSTHIQMPLFTLRDFSALHSFCPASARLVYETVADYDDYDNDDGIRIGSIAISDFLV